MDIDWTGLQAAATAAAARAHAPYSRLRVGAAGLTGDGRVVTGCNVENASYGLTLCAECGLVSALHATAPSRAPGTPAPGTPGTPGDSSTPGTPGTTGDSGTPGAPAEVPYLVAVAVVAGDGEPLVPCGRCRQLLIEAGGPELLLFTDTGPVPLKELLPAAFGAADIASRREA